MQEIANGAPPVEYKTLDGRAVAIVERSHWDALVDWLAQADDVRDVHALAGRLQRVCFIILGELE